MKRQCKILFLRQIFRNPSEQNDRENQIRISSTVTTIAKSTLAAVAGIVAGSVINMGLVTVGHAIVPLPGGADVSTPEKMREAMTLFTAKDFVFPFLAHALGTLAGAFIAAKLAASHRMKFALGIGIFFLIGGITAVAMFGGPLWFKIVDLTLAYLPMGYLGGVLAIGSKKRVG